MALGSFNTSSSDQYPIMNVNVDSVTYDGNSFGGYQVQNIANNYFTMVGMAANTYTPEYGPEMVGWIGGGGSNDNGSNTAVVMRTGSADWEFFKPVVHNYPVQVNPSWSPISAGKPSFSPKFPVTDGV